MDSNGILYGEQTQLTLDNMSFSGERLSEFPTYIQNAAKVKKACALANYTVGNLNRDIYKKIAKACDELIAGKHLNQFPVDVFHGGGGIGINMNLNEVISSLAGDEVEVINHINLSQSTSDVCHSTARMTIQQETESLLEEVKKTARALRKKADEFRGVETIARTCLQDGMRVGAEVLFEGSASVLERRIELLESRNTLMNKVNLGGTVIGTGTGADRAYRNEVIRSLREVTGRDYVMTESLVESAQYPDDLADISSEVERISEVMGKISRDIRWLSSGPETGIAEWIVPEVQKGSSFFPGKTNPVIAEMMIQCSMMIEANDMIIQRCLGLGEAHINLWEEMSGFLLIQSLQRLRRAVRSLRERCIVGIKLNEEVCKKYAKSSIPTIVDYKEKYGYRSLSEKIKRFGVRETIRKIREDKEDDYLTDFDDDDDI